MSEILDKISSYNIFNYLLPGTLFAVLGDALTSYTLIQDNIVIAVFFYYFLGLVVSRIGSLVIEPLSKKTKFLEYAEYSKFVASSKVDPKIDELSETNNMYRTLCALCFVLLAFVAFDKILLQWPSLESTAPYIVLLSCFLMFLFAYRKQTAYVVKRVNEASDNE